MDEKMKTINNTNILLKIGAMQNRININILM